MGVFARLGLSWLALFFFISTDSAAKRLLFPSFKASPSESAGYDGWNTDWFETKLDHFSYSDDRTFKMRYLYNNSDYKPGGPIFFYAGNEGDIEGFAKATGMMMDIAPFFNASVYLAEHRFYGKTQPFGQNCSYNSSENLSYLSSKQTLADYADFLTYLKANKTKDSFPADTKVIAFGGSYGGMLASWFRLKYPHIVTGAWASSAPVLYFKGGGVDYGAFDKVTTATFKAAGCDINVIANGWNALRNLSADDAGRKQLNTIFNVNPMSELKRVEDAEALIGYVREAVEYMAMVDYPYPTAFITAVPLPAWPVKESCKTVTPDMKITADIDIAKAMARIVTVYFNYNNTDPTYQACFVDGCPEQATASLGDPLGWPWQECTEIIIEMCSKGGDNDFFWNECIVSPLDQMNDYCDAVFGSRGWKPYYLHENDVAIDYGLTFEGASNMILTQGALDPWSSGGVRADSLGARKDRGVFVVKIQNSAHHLDLRLPNTCDPSNVMFVRYQAVRVLHCWLDATMCEEDGMDIKDAATSSIPTGECKDIVNGYPWGQNVITTTPSTNTDTTTSAAVTHSILSAFAVLILPLLMLG